MGAQRVATRKELVAAKVIKHPKSMLILTSDVFVLRLYHLGVQSN